MKKILVGLSFLFILAIASISNAQVASGNPEYVQISVSTNIQVLAFDGTRLDWTIHPRNGNVNCIPGLVNTQPSGTAPTTTVGFEFLSGSYLSNFSTPTVSLNCTSESGTVVVDVWIDHRF
jgi:hypothetical protein